MRFKYGLGFLVFLLSLYSCAAQQPGPEFYDGLKKKRGGDRAGAAARFEKALDSKNSPIAEAAAAELMNLRHAGYPLSQAAMAKIRRKAAGPWAEAIAATEDIPAAREKALALLFSGGRERFRDDAAQYTLAEWRKTSEENPGGYFAEVENAAIDGRIAASRSRYGEALLFFRIALRDSHELFLQYPDLLADLGRTFQYAPTGNEGIDLFMEWEKNIAEGNSLIRFLLFFYAGRIAHYRGGQCAEFFAQALPFAPESPADQADSCIWYMMDSALAEGSNAAGPAAISLLETYVSQWRDDSYFADVMGRLARELVRRRQWGDLLRVFSLVRDRQGAAAAQYAWIIGRALEEGLLPPEAIRRAGELAATNIPPAEESADGEYSALPAEIAIRAYFRTAYEAGASALYYRSLSAAALDEPFLDITALRRETSRAPFRSDESETMLFLLGFFRHNAAEFAPRYIRAAEEGLSPGELRRLAEALGGAGMYQQSMRLVSLYIRQDGYQAIRKDLELSHPRPYREMVERYAGETGIEAPLLFALIRTESAFDHNAVSAAGAVGLTQLMPATAEEAAARLLRQGGPDYRRIAADENGQEVNAVNLRDPAANIHIGASYLAYLNGRMEDPLLAILAYNGGMNRVRRWVAASQNLPPNLFLETADYAETRDYGRRVMAAAAVYKSLYY